MNACSMRPVICSTMMDSASNTTLPLSSHGRNLAGAGIYVCVTHWATTLSVNMCQAHYDSAGQVCVVVKTSRAMIVWSQFWGLLAQHPETNAPESTSENTEKAAAAAAIIAGMGFANHVR